MHKSTILISNVDNSNNFAEQFTLSPKNNVSVS